MQYEFYFKIKNSKEHISYNYYGEEGEKSSAVIGDTKKLIDFIKRHCLSCCDVYFDNFEPNTIVIEVYYPPIGSGGPYQMFKRQTKARGK